jgi:hypothetical protein
VRAALALVAMVVASVAGWVGIPVAWLWIGSQIQSATSNLGAALGAALFGAIVSIALMVPLLGRLNEAYRRGRLARGRDDTGNLALEAVVVVTAGLVVVAFLLWFFMAAGTAPFPIVPDA